MIMCSGLKFQYPLRLYADSAGNLQEKVPLLMVGSKTSTPSFLIPGASQVGQRLIPPIHASRFRTKDGALRISHRKKIAADAREGGWAGFK